MSFLKRIALIFYAVTLLTSNVQSAHLVGGDLSYSCLGGNNYEITLHVYKNALTGIELEGVAFIYAIDRDNNTVFDTLYAPQILLDTLPANNIGCVIGSPNVVTQNGLYKGIMNLPLNNSGYDIVYGRCCRTQNLTNTFTNGGKTITVLMTITKEGLLVCGDGPAFVKPPPIIICNSSPLFFDNSAIEDDDDDIRYSFCAPLDGNLTASCDFNGECAGVPLQLNPFPLISWQAGFDPLTPLGNSAVDPLAIDPMTGALTGTAEINGVFLIAICVEEYRNGVLLSTTRRDFQLSVASCQIVIAVSDPVVNSCSKTVDFNNESINTDNWLWDFGDGNTSNEEFPTHTYANPGTYTVTLTAAQGVICENDFVSIVNIEDGPTANFSTDEICIGSSYLFNNTTTDPGSSIVGYEWTIEGNTYTDFEPNVTFPNSGDIDVQLVAITDSGCVDTTVLQMTVRDPIVPDITIGAIYCSNTNVAFGNNSTGHIESVLWNFGDGNTSTDFTPVHDYASPGNYNVTVTLFNSECGNEVVSQMTGVGSSPPIDLGPPLDVCSSGSTTYTLDTTGFGTASIMWSTGDSGPTATINGGTTTLSVTVDNFGCITEDSTTVNNSDPIVVDIDVEDVNCAGSTLVITNNSTGDIDGLLWNFGDGNTSTDFSPSHVYAAAGNYTVSVTLSNAICGNEIYSEPVTVKASIPIELGPPIDVCTGVLDSFTIDTTGFNGAVVNWSTGDTGPTAYFSGGAATLIVTIDNLGCLSGDTVTVISSEAITVDITFTPINCAGTTLSITNNSTGDIDGILWDFGDGNISTDFSPTHVYAGAGTYPISATLSNAVCGDEFFNGSITVKPNIPIELGAPIDVCDGVQQSLTIDTTGYNGALVSWSTGDTGPTAFFSGGSPTVIVSIDNLGCLSGDTVVINALDSIIVDIDIPDLYCSNTPLAFTNNSTGTIQSILWDFGDGNTSTDFTPVHSYLSGGLYTVNVSLVNTVCGSKSYSEDITIRDPLAVNLGPDRDLCEGSVEVFTIDTTGFNGASILWSTGETLPTVNVTGGTISNLSVTVNNGCIATDDVNINSFDSITVDVIILDGYCAGNNITFTNNSTGDISATLWDFGDGGTSTAFSPSYTYPVGGQFTISVDLINTVCGSKNYSKTVNIQDPASFDLGPARDICVGSTEIFTIDTTGMGSITILWSTGETTPTVTVTGGTITDLSVTVDNGCPAMDNVAINSSDSIVLDIQLDDSYCAANSIVFTNNSTGDIQSIIWDFGDGNSSTDFSPEHMYLSGGQFTVSVDLINTICGSKNFTKPIELVAPLLVDIGEPRDICPGLLDSFSIDTLGYDGANILWSTGDTGPTTYVIGGATGLSITVDNGCITTDEIDLTSECEIFAPTAFVPGGINSTFNVIDMNIEEYELRIYNRWGEELFSTSSFTRGWDGTHNGVPAEMDVYVYIIDGRKIGGTTFLSSGVVMLMR